MLKRIDTDEAKAIIQALQEKRDQLKLDDLSLAERMGVSRSNWTMIAAGQRNIGVSLLAGIARTFPEMDDLILAYLRSIPPSVGNGDAHTAKHEASSPASTLKPEV